ncbi:Trp biosynthesis-associated membrane protein [Nocardioides solisilvae]|uniref:Trp biosynthesis-associated membrane protein n=1 Tax=Nocardioides solisilvae TaxID=1542435 RepID=UPI000D7437A6|nr:Trp biosynthesis-associated membrane protein [Nocardioides solisilvae]
MADRTFGPAVLAGLAGGGLSAVAGSRDWVRLEASSGEDAAARVFWEGAPGLAQMPLAAALGLVVLACWGVLLVSRGRLRRAVAGLALVASVGLLATWVVALLTLPDDVADRLAAAGFPAGALERTGWWWAALPAALLAVAAAAVALVRVPSWPAMGSRYDSPSGPADAARAAGTDAGTPAAEQDPTDLWRALDEGRDPTRDPAP